MPGVFHGLGGLLFLHLRDECVGEPAELSERLLELNVGPCSRRFGGGEFSQFAGGAAEGDKDLGWRTRGRC
jgi:hypothetical protein